MDLATLKALRTVLSMDETADEDTVCKAFSAAVESGKITKVGPLDNAAGFEPKALSAMVNTAIAEAIKPLALSVTALTTAQADAQKASEKSQRDTLVQSATTEGKIIPLSADTIATLPIPALAELIKGLPKSNLATKASPAAIVKPGEKGQIKGGTAKVLTLNADNTISVVETSATKSKIGTDRVAEIFQSRISELKAARA